MLATIGKQQHDFCRAVEVGLVRRDEWQRMDELLIHATRITSAEQGLEVEDAAAGHPALALQVEELACDRGIREAGVDAAVQQVGQSAHARPSTSSFVSSISPSCAKRTSSRPACWRRTASNAASTVALRPFVPSTAATASRFAGSNWIVVLFTR